MSSIIVHDIDEWALDDIIVACEADESCTILLDSYGGDLYAGYSIYDYLKGKPKVSVRVIGSCMSAATLVLLGCNPENRTASEHAQFMIHRPLLFWFGTLTQEDSKNVDAAIEEETKKLVAVYKRELPTISDDVLYAMLDAEQIFGANSAQSYGFVNSVDNTGLSNVGATKVLGAGREAKIGNSARGKAMQAEVDHNKMLMFNAK